MLEPINIHIFLAAVFPALGYLSIIYFTGQKLISIKAALVYIMLGCLSISWLKDGIHFIFPNILDLFFLDKTNPILDIKTFTIHYLPTKLSNIFYFFIQVSFKEEFIKLLAFLIALLPRAYFVQNKKDSLFSIMFYSCCVAAGFAVVENIAYAKSFLNSYYTNKEVLDIMWLRSSLSVVIHMICGLIIGYGVACAKYAKHWLEKTFQATFWFFIAVLMHGIYNYSSMFLSSGIEFKLFKQTVDYNIIEILILGLFITFMMGKRMIRLSLQSHKDHQIEKI